LGLAEEPRLVASCLSAVARGDQSRREPRDKNREERNGKREASHGGVDADFADTRNVRWKSGAKGMKSPMGKRKCTSATDQGSKKALDG
jgi:hypothetical protein